MFIKKEIINRTIIILLLVLLIAIFIFGCVEQGIDKQIEEAKPIEEIKQCSSGGQFCGGIAGIMCCEGLTCKLDGDYPDAGGKCVKESGEKIIPEEITKPTQSWKAGSVAIAGKYADADILKLEDNKYRMYYSPEPEVPNFEGQLYSAVSSDGKEWAQEGKTLMNWATFPSVLKLPDGKFRIYFQNQGVIKSATSSDGLSWKEESGTRIDSSNNEGLKLDRVGAPTVIKTGTSYIMVYRGDINEKYLAKVPNNNIQLLLWATSNDGITFVKKGIALDSRNPTFQGLLDGPEFVEWDDGSVRLYFWSYKGVYHISFKDGKFSQEAEFDFTTSSDPMVQFPRDPPGDPALAKINGKWFMYYGLHTKGIYYAVLE